VSARQTPAARRARARTTLARLARAYPGAGLELVYRTPLELLVATVLSAQCTDERVNQVTATLFKRYRSARDWAEADLPALERETHSTGFFRAKARALVGIGRALVERHGGEVPRTPAELTALPGVGRKTANIVLGNAFAIPALAVDTHVARVSQRLELATERDPEAIHDELCAVFPRSRWTRATHLLIAHGRRTCHARRPACGACAVRPLCPWPAREAGGSGRAAGGPGRAGASRGRGSGRRSP
jgi:endonuclease-3